MARNRVLLLSGALSVIFFLAGYVVASAAGTKRPDTAPPPDIGGQPAPNVPLQIDFNKRYDAHCSLIVQGATVFKNVKIVGFTGSKEKQVNTEYSLSSSREKYFEQWLVLEMPDKRLVYIPPSALKYLEETNSP